MKKRSLIALAIIFFIIAGCAFFQRQELPVAEISLQPQTSSLTLTKQLKTARSQLPVSVGDADVQFVMHNISKDNKTKRTISWHSSLPQPYAVLEYREHLQHEFITLPANNYEFMTDQGIKYQHVVKLSGLKPDTSYEYRVGDGDHRTTWEVFHTDSGIRTKALIFPDSQGADYKMWEKNAQTAWKKNPDAQFFINMGDLVDNGQQFWQWARWLDGVSGMIDKIPLAPISGNHEDYTLDWKMTEPHTYLNMFTLPGNEVAGFDEYFYSYDYGDVHFTVLDTQKDELAQFKPDLFARQLAWAEKDLAATDKKWKVVLMHKHIFSFRVNGAFNDIAETFMPLFDKYNVDVVFTGHIHSYRRTVPFYKGEPSEKGTIYISTGAAGERLRINGPPRIAVEAAINPYQSLPNYLVLETNGDIMQIQAFSQKGEQFDSVQLKK